MLSAVGGQTSGFASPSSNNKSCIFLTVIFFLCELIKSRSDFKVIVSTICKFKSRIPIEILILKESKLGDLQLERLHLSKISTLRDEI